MAKTCVFCGATGKLTAEHAFGEWLTRIGLKRDPILHSAGRLNRSLRDQGVSRPFTRTVRDVCGPCNHGWMSRLEAIARRVLSPLVLGKAGSIEEADCAAISIWTHKTALVNMLMTPDADQARGDYLLGRELRNLYEIRDQQLPMSQTRFWIGRYAGTNRIASAWVTPMTVTVEHLADPDVPQAYVMTLIVGEVVLQGVRFTTPMLEFDVTTVQGFAQLWPPLTPIAWPVGTPVEDEAFLKVGIGRNLEAIDPRFKLRPWKPAVDLPDSEAEGFLVRLPTICGEHFVFYPGLLVAEAMRGVFYAFVTSCECGKCYLVVTEHDGAHFKCEAPGDAILQRYEEVEGEEVIISGPGGEFVCKRLGSPAASR